MSNLGGWLWLIIDVVLVALLGAAMIYGIMKWRHRRRDPATEAVREETTRDVYRAEDNRRRVLHEP